MHCTPRRIVESRSVSFLDRVARSSFSPLLSLARKEDSKFSSPSVLLSREKKEAEDLGRWCWSFAAWCLAFSTTRGTGEFFSFPLSLDSAWQIFFSHFLLLLLLIIPFFLFIIILFANLTCVFCFSVRLSNNFFFVFCFFWEANEYYSCTSLSWFIIETFESKY